MRYLPKLYIDIDDNELTNKNNANKLVIIKIISLKLI
jgi:hypothetical protein